MTRPARIVAFVPLRLNSKRVPGKNLRPVAGKPLCVYIFESLRRVEGIDAIYAYCSDRSVSSVLPAGVEFLKRPRALDDDAVRGLEIYRSFAAEVQADVYVLAHATSPFLRSSSIERGLRRLFEEDRDSAFSVQRLQTFAWFDGNPINYAPRDVPRTQELEPVFVETSGFYIYLREVLEGGRRIGDRPAMIEVTQIEAIDIDYPEDLELAERVAGTRAAGAPASARGARRIASTSWPSTR